MISIGSHLFPFSLPKRVGPPLANFFWVSFGDIRPFSEMSLERFTKQLNLQYRTQYVLIVMKKITDHISIIDYNIYKIIEELIVI